MRRFFFALALLLSTLLGIPALAHADVNDFTITDFTADYTLTHSDPQGELDTHENITVDFTDYNHGILRALPEHYNGQNLRIKVAYIQLDGRVEKYTTYTSNGNLVLKIGDPNQTITGTHTYMIKYSVQNVIRFTSDRDELDWNTNGTEWTQPFDHISATLNLPGNIGASAKGQACYTGSQGSTAHDCTVTTHRDFTTFTTTRTLQGGENMTFVADFPLGTFQKPTAKDWWADHAVLLIEAVGLPLIALLLAGSWWYKNGKDIGGRGTIIPEYAPPNGLGAAEADTVAHYRPGKNAISATIIDLAIRKYLKIQESESKGVLGLGKHKEYVFIQLSPPAKGSLKDYEAQIIAGLFASGDTVTIADLKNKFYTTAKVVNKLLPKQLTAAGYFVRDPARTGNIGHVLGIILLLGGFFVMHPSPGLAIGAIASAIIIFGFASLMPRRTQKGEDTKDAIEGLKLYMNTAEKDRIAMLQSPDAPYAPKSTEPVKTVELFEKLLPFAMVLGVEKEWGKQFESIYTTPPDWYGGNWATFNAVYFASSLSDSMSAMNTSFAAPSSSGGGGGFSGGGGGGGGGGGW